MDARVLLVDDDPDLREVIVDSLRPLGFHCVAKASASEALAALHEQDWDVVVTDISMSPMNGLALCERVVANRPNLPVVLITAYGTLETAVGAVRAGAYDFVTKPFELDVLVLALQRAVKHHRLHVEVKRLREVVARSVEMDGMIGTSPPMRQVYEMLDRLSAIDATILVTGPTGSGKELVARALHRRGLRAAGPFVAVNCAAIPAALLESELFGHVKGAYTGAHASRRGLILQAQGGTLFLDEISEMPTDMQVKLLRVLEARVVRAVGGDHEESFDTRIITASNRDLETEVKEKRFRDDLYYRINVVQIDVPPLSARGPDILLLARHFLERAATQMHKPVSGLSSAVVGKLFHYAWPGNVRELENCIERAVAMTRTEELTVADLPEKIRAYQDHDLALPGGETTEISTLAEVERTHILRALAHAGGSKTAAAALLGLHVSTLYRKLEQYRTDANGQRALP